MARTNVTSVDQYIASQPEATQRLLARLRATIRKALPGAEELISYGIPAYKLNGRTVLYFAGWTHHYSLYPSTAGLVAVFKDDLARYEVSKGTIRFPLSEPVPVKLIAAIAQCRAREVTERKIVTRPHKRRAAWRADRGSSPAALAQERQAVRPARQPRSARGRAARQTGP
jgi:uncharacterized protein YdhG (YjbR/CyaY superfamily)